MKIIIVTLSLMLVAYFNEDGDLLGSARDITPKQLSLPVLQSFDKHFADIINTCWIILGLNEEIVCCHKTNILSHFK